MSKNIVLKLKKLDEGLPTPAYANPGDAGSTCTRPKITYSRPESAP